MMRDLFETNAIVEKIIEKDKNLNIRCPVCEKDISMSELYRSEYGAIKHRACGGDIEMAEGAFSGQGHDLASRLNKKLRLGQRKSADNMRKRLKRSRSFKRS